MEELVILGDILENYFGCKKPFLKTPKPMHTEYGLTSHEYFTVRGLKAYEELVDLVYSLRVLGVVSDKECDSIVDSLDMIAYRVRE